MNKRLQVSKYVFFDIFSAIIAWGLFFIYRKNQVNDISLKGILNVLNDPNLYKGLIFIPLFWIALYLMIGTYRKIYRKSRLKELEQTLSFSVNVNRCPLLGC